LNAPTGVSWPTSVPISQFSPRAENSQNLIEAPSVRRGGLPTALEKLRAKSLSTVPDGFSLVASGEKSAAFIYNAPTVRRWQISCRNSNDEAR